MPNAYRRGPAGAARRRGARPSGSPARPADLACSPEEARKRFRDYARRAGEPMEPVRQLIPAGPHGECWSNAWDRVARSAPLGYGWRYCEGVVLVPTTGRDRQWVAHAWIVDGTGTVLEGTDGYDAAIQYRGWSFSLRSIEAACADWDAGPRSSVVEAAIANGIPTEQAVYWLRIDPR